MTFQKIFIMGVLLLTLNNCGTNYESYEEFRAEDKSDRISTITSILDENQIKGYTKFTLIYINHVITTVDFYQVLERQFPDPKFMDFLKKAVITLHYAYNSDNLKLSPDKWRKEAEKFLIANIKYDYSYGEEKFREYLKEKLQGYNTWIFTFHSKEQLKEWAEGDAYDWCKRNLQVFAWRSGKFVFRDFKKLGIKDQALVIRNNAWRNLKNNDKLDEDIGKGLKAIQNRWKKHSAKYLKNRLIRNLSDDTPFTKLFDKIIDVMF